MPPNKLTEVREADASPEIAAIYADIKEATGIPQVNLIYRHLAICPPVLAWAWDVVGPIYRHGLSDAVLARLDADTGTNSAPPIWQDLDPAEATKLQAVLAFYNRGNPANLIALSALVRAGGQVLPYRTRQEVPPVVRPPAGGTIPPLPRPDVLPPAAMALILELAARQGGSRLGVTPSLYLHLGLWPAAVSAAHAQIMPLLDSPAWPVRLTRLLSSTDVLAGEIAGSLSATLPPPEPDILQPLLDTVAIFVKATIPEMVLIGRMLARPDA